MKIWQSISVTLCAAAALAHTALAADETNLPKKPVMQWSCQEFLDVRDNFKPQVIYWTEAINKKGKISDAWIDVSGTEKVIPMVVEDCKAEPNANFWKKIKASWQKAKNSI